jgi:hypothetical protein
MIITFDQLNELQHSLVRWKALAKATPSNTTHSQFGHTTREQDHKNPHGLTTPKKNIVL